MNIWAFPCIYPFDHPELHWKGIFAHRQYKGLINNGANVKVIVPIPWFPPKPFSNMHKEWKKYADWGYPESTVYDGVTVYYPRIPARKPSRLEKRPYPERYVQTVLRFFREQHIKLDPKKDFFYSQWLPESAMAQEVAHRLGVKSGVLAIGDDVIVYPREKQAHFDVFAKVWKEADIRCAVADYLCVEANKLVGQDLPYDVIHMGAEYNKFMPVSAAQKLAIRKRHGIPEGKVAVLNVGSSIVRKGWLDLMDALAEVKKTNDNFVLVGVFSVPFDIDLREEAAKRGLTDNFVPLGEVKPAVLNEIYNACDIFCLPSHWEGIACVLLEAMSSGLPAVTTAMCGHPEVVNSGTTGLLVPPKEPAVLATALADLINDKNKRETLGANAREFIVNDWGDFDDNARRLYQRIEEVMGIAK